MLTRRGFAGVASCAICAATGLVATEVAAQNAPVATTPGVTRKILSQMDGPAPGYQTIIAEATIEPGMKVARHTHPGIESGYVIEGNLELPIEGQPARDEMFPQLGHRGVALGVPDAEIVVIAAVPGHAPPWYELFTRRPRVGIVFKHSGSDVVSPRHRVSGFAKPTT